MTQHGYSANGIRYLPVVYVVVWDAESIVKVGATGDRYGRRYRPFLASGGRLAHLFHADPPGSEYELEELLDVPVKRRGRLAFHQKSDAIPYLGGVGDGYMECYRVRPDHLEHLIKHVLPSIAHEYQKAMLQAVPRNATLRTYVDSGYLPRSNSPFVTRALAGNVDHLGCESGRRYARQMKP